MHSQTDARDHGPGASQNQDQNQPPPPPPHRPPLRKTLIGSRIAPSATEFPFLVCVDQVCAFWCVLLQRVLYVMTPPPPARALVTHPLCSEAAEGVNALHTAVPPIVHRDIKGVAMPWAHSCSGTSSGGAAPLRTRGSNASHPPREPEEQGQGCVRTAVPLDQGCIARGGRTPPHPPGRPAYAQPLSP